RCNRLVAARWLSETYDNLSIPFNQVIVRDTSACHQRAHRLDDDVHDDARRGHDRRVIDRIRSHLRLHPGSYETLRFGHDHAIFLRHQEPAWTILPQRPSDLGTD